MDVATNYNEASFKLLISVLLLFKCDQASDLWQQLDDDDDDDDDDESFLRIVDCRKAFSLISSRDHCQRFSQLSCAVVITTTMQRHLVDYDYTFFRS